jgi:AcrR family transcriptional regulator
VPAQPKVNRGPAAGPANRQALIDAAREVFAETGFLAPLSSVAKRAGVGQGSLYRHFPDRISLGIAVFDENITSLEQLAALSTATLSDLFGAIAAQAVASTGLIELTASNRHDPRAAHLETRVTAVAAAILERDRRNDFVRNEVTTDDVMLSFAMLAFALSHSDPADRAAVAERAQAIFRAAFAR